MSFSGMNAANVVILQRERLHELLEQANMLLEQNLPLMSAKVFNQGPDNACCGYLALGNGLNLLRAKQSGSIDPLVDMNSADCAHIMMDSWRLKVRKARLKPKITDYLTGLIMNHYLTCSALSANLRSGYSKSDEFSVADFEQSVRVKIASVIKRICGCAELLQESNESYICNLTKEGIYTQYGGFMYENAQSNGSDSSEMDLFLASRDVFDALFTDFNISEEFFFGEDVKVGEAAPRRFAVDSDWLVSEDIEMLFNYEKDQVGSCDTETECLFYYSGITEHEMVPFQNLKSRIERNDDVSAIILICTSQPILNSNGHWFTLVVSVNKDGQEYIVTDSIGENRTMDESVHFLLNYLRGESFAASAAIPVQEPSSDEKFARELHEKEQHEAREAAARAQRDQEIARQRTREEAKQRESAARALFDQEARQRADEEARQMEAAAQALRDQEAGQEAKTRQEAPTRAQLDAIVAQLRQNESLLDAFEARLKLIKRSNDFPNPSEKAYDRNTYELDPTKSKSSLNVIKRSNDFLNPSEKAYDRNAYELDPTKSKSSLRKPIIPIIGLAVAAALGKLVHTLFYHETENSSFRSIKQSLAEADEYNTALEVVASSLKNELETTTKENISNEASVISAFKHCNVKELTAQLEAVVSVAKTEMKNEWTDIRATHGKFLSTWHIIRDALNAPRASHISDLSAGLTGGLVEVRDVLNKMYSHLDAIDMACGLAN